MWKHIESGIEVIADFRYLGAHLTTRQATSSSTLDKRSDKAKQQLRRLRHCPASTEAKAKVILAKVYAGAMYGVEAASASPKKSGALPLQSSTFSKAETTTTMPTSFSPPSPGVKTTWIP
jgi:hypothetical protein